MGTVTALRAKTRRSPTTKNRKVTRSREYLTPDEVDRLMAAAAKVGRYGHRERQLRDYLGAQVSTWNDRYIAALLGQLRSKGLAREPGGGERPSQTREPQ